MADGILVMNTAEAVTNAEEMRKIANDLEYLLNIVSEEMNNIDNEDALIYFGGKNPADIRSEINSFRQFFNAAYEQIDKSAGDIIAIANAMEQQ